MSHQSDPLRDPRIRQEVKQAIIDLYGESLACTNPTFLADAQNRIERIVSSRVRSLEGDERYRASQFFEAVQRIPILFNDATDAIIAKAMAEHCTLIELTSVVRAEGAPLAVKDFTDQWGYVSLPSGFEGASWEKSGGDPNVAVPVDLVVAARNFQQNINQALLLWDSFEGEMRRVLLDDWCQILENRYDLELVPSIILEEPDSAGS